MISITEVVLVKRYFQCIKMYESSTGGVEFVAGAKVIPLFLSWIVDNKTAFENNIKYHYCTEERIVHYGFDVVNYMSLY